MKKVILILLISIVSQLTYAASNMLVWPIYQMIESDQKGSILWLENRGNNDVNLQVRILRWNQKDQQDVYQDQQDVVASPPFMLVPAGQRQLVRILKQVNIPAQQELAYRIVIDEIPSQVQPAQATVGLNLQMRYVLPLFLYGNDISTVVRTDKKHGSKTVTQPVLRWNIESQGNKKFIAFHNSGIVHARISNVFFGDSNDPQKASTVIAKGLLGYVLPGQKMVWSIDQNKIILSDKKLFVQLEDNSPAIEITKY